MQIVFCGTPFYVLEEEEDMYDYFWHRVDISGGRHCPKFIVIHALPSYHATSSFLFGVRTRTHTYTETPKDLFLVFGERAMDEHKM